MAELYNTTKQNISLHIKNIFDEDELKVLNNLVSGYFDFAEIQAIRHNPMHMEDYIKHLDLILSSTGEKLLTGDTLFMGNNE